jgi:hypothetical protein
MYIYMDVYFWEDSWVVGEMPEIRVSLVRGRGEGEGGRLRRRKAKVRVFRATLEKDRLPARVSGEESAHLRTRPRVSTRHHTSSHSCSSILVVFLQSWIVDVLKHKNYFIFLNP